MRARIDTLNEDAWAARFREHERADALAREALALAEGCGYGAGIALALRTLAVHDYHFHAEYERALHRLQRALALLDETGEDRGRADVLSCMAWVYRRRGELTQAMRLHTRALHVARAVGPRLAEARALDGIGGIYYLLGDYGRALEESQSALALHEEINNPAGFGNTLINVGIIHGMLGEPERAIEYMLRALAIHEGTDAHGMAVCLANLGNSYAELGDHDRALDYLQRAADHLGALGDHSDESSCLCDLGRLHELRGDGERALECYLRSLELIRRIGGRVYEPEALMRLGALLVARGDAAEGLARLHEALELAEAQGARQQVHAIHEALAAAYEVQGDTPRALEHHRAFHAVWREVFGSETNLRIQNAIVRAEVQQTQREAEILREKNDALTRADEEKARLLAQLQEQAAELERQTREDALTGLSNRRHLDERLAAEWERAVRFRRAMTVAMADVDYFKQVNDRFSHAVGDEVLRTVARILRENTRGVDVVARYGGEEFCLILVETAAAEGAQLCDRLRLLVEAYDWASIRPGLAVTISIGIAALHEEIDAPDALLAAADARLYAAKHAGRNRVCD